MIFIAEYYLLEGVLAITVFQRNLDLVNRIAGAIIMVLALQTMGVLRFGWLARERRFHLPVSSGATGGLLLGLTFAAGWLPCLGPQLGAILTLAQNREFGGLPVHGPVLPRARRSLSAGRAAGRPAPGCAAQRQPPPSRDQHRRRR